MSPELYCRKRSFLKREMTDMNTTLNPAPKPTDVNGGATRDVNCKNSPFGVFRTLFESGRANDFEAMADTIDEDCEWTMMPNMKTFKGKSAVVEMCKQGKLASDKTPEVIFDEANSEWGVFEYMNRGTITKELSALAATTDWQFPADPSTLVGRQYAVPVCFVYHINAKGKIYRLHEYLDLGGLMKQLK
jgi:hypothetical protein